MGIQDWLPTLYHAAGTYFNNIYYSLQILGTFWDFQKLWKFGHFRIHLDTFGYIWTLLDTFGHLWIHLDTFGYILTLLDTFKHLWTHLDMPLWIISCNYRRNRVRVHSFSGFRQIG